jgi:hypothetical protein
VRRSKWISAGLMPPIGNASGLRLEVDILRRGAWNFGAAGSATGGEVPLTSSSGDGYMSLRDLKLMAYVARVTQRGRWQLRPAAGVGVMQTDGLAYDGYSFYEFSGAFPTVEASLTVSRELGKSWALYAGPLGTVTIEQFEVMSSTLDYSPRMLSRGVMDIGLFGGVRRRL